MKNNLRVILAYQQKTVTDVHEDTGISKTTLFNLFHERSKNPNLQTVIKLADYLNVSLDELLGINREVY
ncbi:helix-turn-helix domain-containing protein [Fundicoccus sp. Sow4_H7]|uniref:helix-turn-helix domain-containing protein n=1 Tax=Fundicoccus sp. Sow4_H7 TaxID=3438784 RepID=UPI003F8E220B